MQGMLGNVVQLCAQKKGEMGLVDIVFSEEVEIVQTTLIIWLRRTEERWGMRSRKGLFV